MPMGMSSSVAATIPGDPDRLFGDMLPWLGAFVVVVLVGGALALWLRRRFRADDERSGDGYSLQDLRAMHARGELSDEEFKSAKDALISGLHADVRAEPQDQFPPP